MQAVTLFLVVMITGVSVLAQHDIVRVPCRDPNNFDPSTCLFAGDYCDLNANFSLFYDQALPYSKYIEKPVPEIAEFVVESGAARIQDGNLALTLVPPSPSQLDRGVATIVSTTRFLHYGLFEATFKVPGLGGTVTSFIGYSNVKDEIDLEITGYDNVSVQANWYYRGLADTFASNGSSVNGFIGKTNQSTAAVFQTYTVNWTQNDISWYIDGRLMHRATKAKDGKKGFPDSPMRISFGIWQAQVNSTWAGPSHITDWSRQIATQFTALRVSCLEGPHNQTRTTSSDQLTHPSTGYNPDQAYTGPSSSSSSWTVGLIMNLSVSVMMITLTVLFL